MVEIFGIRIYSGASIWGEASFRGQSFVGTAASVHGSVSISRDLVHVMQSRSITSIWQIGSQACDDEYSCCC